MIPAEENSTKISNKPNLQAMGRKAKSISRLESHSNYENGHRGCKPSAFRAPGND